MTETAFIYEAIRTPRSKGKPSGALHEVKPVALGAGLLTELQKRHDLDTSRVDDVILGCTSPIGEQGGVISKTITQYANWDESVPAMQLDRFCGSGLEAINIAAMKIASGWVDLIVAGGVESMSRVGMGASGGAAFNDPAVIQAIGKVPQGIGADTIATIEGWSREDIDIFSLESQKRATFARDSGYFDNSIVPVKDCNEIVILEQDDFIKPDTTLEVLGNLRAAFGIAGQIGYDDVILQKYPHLSAINHVHTAGSSSGIVDGASVVLIGSKRAGRELNLTPRARIVSSAVLASDPFIMLVGPGPAAKKALDIAGLKTTDIDIFEINEAFASVAMRFMKDLDISPEITNVNGGAIALGHPLGATGAMLIGTVLDELERRKLKRGLIALCVAGGMGIATIIERV